MKITTIATAGTHGCAGPRHRQQLRTAAPSSPQLGTRVPATDAVHPSAPDERCP